MSIVSTDSTRLQDFYKISMSSTAFYDIYDLYGIFQSLLMDLDEHVKHVKLVLDILGREKLYLSRHKLHFIQPILKLLGRIINNQGIRMDPDKVDSMLKWKVPTNRDLL